MEKTIKISRGRLADAVGLPPGTKFSLGLPLGSPADGDDAALIVFIDAPPRPDQGEDDDRITHSGR